MRPLSTKSVNRILEMIDHTLTIAGPIKFFFTSSLVYLLINDSFSLIEYFVGSVNIRILLISLEIHIIVESSLKKIRLAYQL